MTNTVDRSFKYAMMDTTKIYIGGRMTYQEMIEWEDVPFKIKAIVNKEFVPDAGGTQFTFEEHLCKLQKESYALQSKEGELTTEDGELTKPVTEEISFSKLAVMVFSA